MPTALNLVNILQGTDSRPDFSRGNTLPLAALPHGMAHWSLMTSHGPWFFDPHRPLLHGIRCTHQPSPWIGDYGAFTVMAQAGPLKLAVKDRQEPYVLSKSLLHPNLIQVEFPCLETRMELAPTRRGAVLRVSFPPGAKGRLLIQAVEGKSEAGLDGREAWGAAWGAAGGCPEEFGCHWRASFSRPPQLRSLLHKDSSNEPDLSGTGEGPSAGLCLEFDPSPEPLIIWVATSFIDQDQARWALKKEVEPLGLEEAASRAGEAWGQFLDLFEVETDREEDARTFFSCLYRTLLFPRLLGEEGPDGVRHRSPYSGRVCPGEGVTDNGFWDTYRTVYPLYSLVDQSGLSAILDGWVSSCQEGGWFPQWASPGYRSCMVGTHIDAVFADAITRGIPFGDPHAALDGMIKHSQVLGHPDGAWGRIGVEDYLRLGWVPCDRHHESACRTLDYAYDDWCIAQAAYALGRTSEGDEALARSGSWRHLYDPGTGFMRGRLADGSWKEPWEEFRWGDPYVEGGAWQALWGVPHDVPGLIEVMGGKAAFLAKLERLMVEPPRFEVGVYGTVIHEMTEMACAGFGQYAHSNQPVHHCLTLFGRAGRPDLMNHWTGRVMRELYSPDHLPGDEDNGEMSAWFVLNAMGLYPSCPGRPDWMLGSPLFDRLTLNLGDGRTLRVEKGSGDVKPAWNGEQVSGLDLSHSALIQGGTLVLPSTP